tara:strand:+ start:161 stop:421 length:261 start_codon:yes stop_codon:yes gene_type:complete
MFKFGDHFIVANAISRKREKNMIDGENYPQETQLEHEPIMKEDITWNQAVQKIESVINDVCREYEKDGHPYYADSLLKYWRRILKG